MEELDILLPRHTLEEALGPELARQYRIKRGEKHLYMPVTDGSRYLCSCGCVNSLGEPCKDCGSGPELLDRGVLDALSREAELRLQQEEEEAARQEAARLEAEKQKKRKKRLKICGYSFAFLLKMLFSYFCYYCLIIITFNFILFCPSHYQFRVRTIRSRRL